MEEASRKAHEPRRQAAEHVLGQARAKKISAIQMNNGSEVSAQLLLELNTAVAMTLPMGADENSIMPMAPTPISDRAIQTPDPSSWKRLNSRIKEKTQGSFFCLPPGKGEHRCANTGAGKYLEESGIRAANAIVLINGRHRANHSF